ncbi:hypothetical protein [Aeromonas veronii]|jgi:hypothetical protein|uniref:YvrJ family protein n=1 Tax=Aeromonas veronii TaxID=654 RepID=A0AAW5MGA9_AERVE|nr:hypothetical protein [Aeromonas veronii]MBL0489548.1 hypothetical protein [Aeromonas veronii]MCR4450772.1 hypothetical protein [Aeromonas veronii]MCX0443432.1 hypothetical protein [Aeromonas veronii]
MSGEELLTWIAIGLMIVERISFVVMRFYEIRSNAITRELEMKLQELQNRQ